MKPKKIVPPIYFFCCILLAVVLHFIIPIKQITPPGLNFVGILLFLGGMGLVFWTVSFFKKHDTPLRPGEPSTTFITDGPFKFSRNPIYLGGTIALIGISIFLGSLITFVAPLFFFLTIRMRFIPYEETLMEQTFGEEYLQYKSRVRRWI